jgi:hypothetical protein
MPAAPPAPLPSVVESREDPAAAVRVTPIASAASIAARLSAPEVPLAAPARAEARAAQIDEGDAQAERLPTDRPAVPVAADPRSPEPRAANLPSRGGMALRRLPWLARIGADAVAALRLLAEAITLYRRGWRPFLLLVAILLLPVAATKSCMVAAITGSAAPNPLVQGSATTVDLSRVKQELARRVGASRAQGKVDKAALAELAALETVSAAEKAGAGTAAAKPSELAVIALWFAGVLLTGLLVFGLAVPLVYATLTFALVYQCAGAPLPSFLDVWILLWRRRLHLVAALLPAAALVALGGALFLLPGLVVAALLLFVPVVVLFERVAGKAALLRSMALVRTDAVRVIVVMLAAAVLGAAASGLAELATPDSSRRIMVFLRLFVGDLLLTVVLPVPALAAARLYVDLRSREGVDASALARAARR